MTGRNLIWKMRLHTLGKGLTWGLSGAAIAAFALLYMMAGEIYDYQDTVDGVHLPPVDAVVCLAGGRGRISAAADIWYRYWELSQAPLKEAGQDPAPVTPPFLYLSGMGSRSNWNVLARHVRRGVLTVLKPENVIMETESANTSENAQWVARYAAQRGWERLLIITSPYHMRRSKFIFERVLNRAGRKVRVETLTAYQEPFDSDDWRSGFFGIRVTMTEYLKWIYYRSFWNP